MRTECPTIANNRVGNKGGKETLNEPQFYANAVDGIEKSRVGMGESGVRENVYSSLSVAASADSAFSIPSDSDARALSFTGLVEFVGEMERPPC